MTLIGIFLFTSSLKFIFFIPKIMKVITEEAKSTGKTEEMPLKILAHNNLIGRIIGKQARAFIPSGFNAFYEGRRWC